VRREELSKRGVSVISDGKVYAIVRFEPLTRPLPHSFPPFLEYFQPLLVNAFSPLVAEVREVHLYWPPPDRFCVS